MGSLISEDGVSADPSNVAAIRDMPSPQDKKSGDEVLWNGELPETVLPPPVTDHQPTL